MKRLPPSRPAAQHGVTLIELMVALVISMLLAMAVMLVQKNLVTQKSRGSDVALRDNEARAAMDLIAHDMSGGGFLLGGTDLRCDELFTYNSAAGGGYVARLPVDAMAAAANAVVPFAPTLTLNYPTAAQNVPSDVLAINGATDATTFGNGPTGAAPTVPLFQNPTYSPMNAGVMPVTTTTGLTAGHVGVLQIPNLSLAAGSFLTGVAYPNRQAPYACIRLPISAISIANRTVSSAAGAIFPGAYVGGFSANLMAANGFTGPLSDALIYNGSALVDLGAPTPANPTPTQRTTVYYIDNSNAWPTLMRAQYSLLDDAMVAMPQQAAPAAQPVAAGVVSLQVLFGVDPGSTGQVTAYKTAAQVKAAPYLQHVILTAKVLLVTRTLYPDPETNANAADAYIAPPTVAIPSNAPTPGDFQPVPIPAAFAKYRFVAHVTETALRDFTWTP